MRSIITKMNLNGTNIPRVLLVDDVINAKTSGDILAYTTYASVAEATQAVAQILGDDFFIDSMPYRTDGGYWGSGVRDLITTMFYNAYVGSAEDTIIFSGINLGMYISGTNAIGDCYPSGGATGTGVQSPIGSEIISDSGPSAYQYRINVYKYVFSEAEVAGNKINISGTSRKHCIKVYFALTPSTGSCTAQISAGEYYMYNPQSLAGADIPPLTPPDTDPYSQGGNSSIGGGTGTFSETGDIVGIPGLPTLSAVDTGFITLFNPTAAQVKQLASYMWSSGFDLDTFKNIVANPMDCILGLTIVPVDPPNAGTKAVTVGNIPTSVNMPYLSSQYVAVDCGTLNVQEFWGSYLDYSPYTKMSLYLPYIGIVPLDIDDVMNASISITYHVDVLSGACVAYVLCNGTQLYTYIGQCSSNVPVTSNDFTNTVNGILGIAGNIGSLVMSGGASAPSDITGIASNAINALKPNVQKSGAMSGTGGLMGVQTPYLICQRPRQSVPESQNTYTGYPSNITSLLADLSGYTEVEKIHLEGVPCTNEEMEEIMQLLESGVYI